MSLHTKPSPTWRYALLAGLPAAPGAIWHYVQSGSDIEFSGIVVFTVLAGYLAKTSGLDATPVGLRAGIVAAVPVTLWVLADAGRSISGFHQPGWMTVAQVFVLLVLAGVSLVGGALSGMIGARIGGWLAERGDHPQSAVGS
ncbi:DUF5518 domain-containing protein [Haloarcula salinisoli]|uniref:DUF5518 domain-containing protein n=1 Tax=Haloarcula salinisoli TaxID=2487746 RepID=A0A8J7YHN3_9EURY|nr:DUF5518 domain-containing protein [Halomicroarcula salinisoli]MBX0286435.1 DUF5518 domain-containing protein [Halomicroarcula salinisoli]MBX0302076.1 DUF5518 domain-containing protein [Halomicroarcula salinisoli]